MVPSGEMVTLVNSGKSSPSLPRVVSELSPSLSVIPSPAFKSSSFERSMEMPALLLKWFCEIRFPRARPSVTSSRTRMPSPVESAITFLIISLLLLVSRTPAVSTAPGTVLAPLPIIELLTTSTPPLESNVSIPFPLLSTIKLARTSTSACPVKKAMPDPLSLSRPLERISLPDISQSDDPRNTIPPSSAKPKRLPFRTPLVEPMTKRFRFSFRRSPASGASNRSAPDPTTD